MVWLESIKNVKISHYTVYNTFVASQSITFEKELFAM